MTKVNFFVLTMVPAMIYASMLLLQLAFPTLRLDCQGFLHWPSLRPRFILSAFHLCGKTGCSGGKSNGTGLSAGNFSEKKEYLQRYSSFPVSPGMTRKFLFHLQQPVCSLKEQGRQVTQRTLKCTR